MTDIKHCIQCKHCNLENGYLKCRFFIRDGMVVSELSSCDNFDLKVITDDGV